ncbi:MAG TPA: hypothetical protein VGS12_17560 [Caulobacteraceae bacterium]|nr:hypothetical protein [Caulobacteraceae bacterium]
MPDPTDRRTIIGGAAIALAAGLVVAAIMILLPAKPGGPPPASQGGLTVQSVPQDASRLDPRKPLRCFVNGAYVGAMPLADCAKRNGVASGSLDVGLDASGDLAASNGGSTAITPLPPPLGAAAAPPPTDTSAPPQGPTQRAILASCWRYEAGGWSVLPYELGLQACARALYDGRCESPGAAAYGRWGERTLRLVPGSVEISADNRTFRTLTPQGPGCTVPAFEQG